MRSILQFILNLLRRYGLLRLTVTIISGLLLVTSTWLWFGVHIFPDWYFNHFRLIPDLVSQPLLAAMSLSAIIFGLCVLSYTKGISSVNLGSIELELEPIRKEREQIRQRIEQKHDAAANVLDTIELGLNQIAEYYTINKSQARNSFSFSVFAIVAGLITLIGGIWLFYFAKTPNVGLAALSGIGGVLLQFIGGASFYIYNKSLAQLNYFYDKLIRMQDTMLSIRLCDELDDARKKPMLERLIVEILTRQGNIVLPDIPFTVPGAPKEPPKSQAKTAE